MNLTYFGVDQLKWNDLSMDDFFKNINYTKTSGTEYLFNQIRDRNFSKDLDTDEKMYRLMETDDGLYSDDAEF